MLHRGYEDECGRIPSPKRCLWGTHTHINSSNAACDAAMKRTQVNGKAHAEKESTFPLRSTFRLRSRFQVRGGGRREVERMQSGKNASS